jgi:hypothetical protein
MTMNVHEIFEETICGAKFWAENHPGLTFDIVLQAEDDGVYNTWYAMWNMKKDIAQTGWFIGTLAEVATEAEKLYSANSKMRDEYRLWIGHFKAVKALRYGV